jgi:hypothetical protein
MPAVAVRAHLQLDVSLAEVDGVRGFSGGHQHGQVHRYRRARHLPDD